MPMSKTEYVNHLRAIYYAANMSDAGDDFDGNPLKPEWMKGDECAVHCQAIERIVRDMGLGENWLEEGI